MGEHIDALLRRAGYRLRHRQSWMSGRIDLSDTEEGLWSRMASTFRNRVRNAEKAGAALRIADDAGTYAWMVARHIENMDEKGFAAASPSLLETLRATSPGNVTVFQLVHDGAAVAGMSVVRFGTHAEYHIGWFGPEGRKLNAGNFLMWNVLLELKRRGVATFDVGGLKPGDGYTRFKRTMKPDEYVLAGEWVSF
jgi:lipid II:glycine glycyltransferase (peptidoglycan interpeptide bridge formation enzyme)